MVKKGFMLQLWRMQQSQALISVFFWALTLAGVFYLNYFHPVFVSVGLPESAIAIGTTILFILIVLAFLLMGFIYDRFLRLWREQTDVIVERNPYSRERLLPKEIVFWRRGTLALMKELAKKDSAIQKDIEFMEKWIAKSMADYEELKEAVASMEKWVAE